MKVKQNYLPLFYLSDMEREIRKNLKEDAFETFLPKYRKESEIKLSQKESVKKILKFINDNHITDDDMKVFNKILGDHQILSKIIFVSDGSYRSHKIFFSRFNFKNMNSSSISIIDHYFKKDDYGLTIHIDPIDHLNVLKHKYESIFIQLIDDKFSKRDDYDDYGEDLFQ